MSRVSKLSSAAGFTVAAALGFCLGGCGPDRMVTGSVYPTDYRERHPIILADVPRKLDIFLNGIGLDRRQHEDVWAFAIDYQNYGKGPIAAQIPTGAGTDFPARRTLDAVRGALAEAGLPDGVLSVSTYTVTEPRAASVIRLSFEKLQAKVATKCGLWPQDLGVSDYRASMTNDPYWNLGCSVQSNVASQVADPIDLVRGHQEGRIDTIRRAKKIDNLRQAKDPSTQYRQDGQGKINQQVGN